MKRISVCIATLHQLKRLFPPLKELVVEAFFFVFAVIEIVKFLWRMVSG